MKRWIINATNTEPLVEDCGCTFTPNRGLVHFRFCLLHEAAPELLAALKDIAEHGHVWARERARAAIAKMSTVGEIMQRAEALEADCRRAKRA